MKNNLFTQVAVKAPKESTFDLTHDVKMSGKMGQLMPCMTVEVLPGDKIKLGADAFIRLAPILAPIMHRVDFTIHYFFVPNRLLWPNWEKFISGTLDDLGNAYVPPYIAYDNSFAGDVEFVKLMDYIGIPPATGTETENVSALPLAAYNLIYNEYYRDQNLIQPIPENMTTDLGDGDVTGPLSASTLRYRAWEHDYFTACLPFAQKGAAVDIPLGDVVLKDDWSNNLTPGAGFPRFVKTDGFDPVVTGNNDITQEELLAGGNVVDVGGYKPTAYNPAGSLETAATTINDLRRAYRLQEWLEKNARGGTRYTEQIWVHFQVKSPDARLQRPEYITGVKAPIIVTEVLNTAGPTEYFNSETNTAVQTGSPQGDMTGHGAGLHQGRIGRYYAQEHGWIMGIISIMPKTAYQQGIHRQFTRNDFLDYAFPTFANLGEQEVKVKEVYAYDINSEQTFGYIPRYAEYKFMNSRVAGDFRTTLDFWHLGRIFANTPTLNQEFIECIPDDVLRIFAVRDTTDNIWMHILNKAIFKRKLPFFGTPSM